MTDIIERLLNISRGDHERGCTGREYTCSCGYDAETWTTAEQAVTDIKALRSSLKEIREENDRLKGERDRMFRENVYPRFNEACRRYEAAEASCEAMAKALEQIRDACPSGSSWTTMSDGTWRSAARDFQSIARVALDGYRKERGA